jgi:hypothetical protein
MVTAGFWAPAARHVEAAQAAATLASQWKLDDFMAEKSAKSGPSGPVVPTIPGTNVQAADRNNVSAAFAKEQIQPCFNYL